MIARITGTLAAKDLDRVEITTDGGVAYELVIPLSVFEMLPRVGEPVMLFTHLVVRDDGWLLCGFASALERRVFQRLLSANGVGPALALGMLSTLSADRLVRAIRERDVATLQGVPRVGRKKAERLVLDLADKMDDVQGEQDAGSMPSAGATAEDAVRALVSLGYHTTDADKAVRAALDQDGRGKSVSELIRMALNVIGGRK
ncbi:MAG TPA: Holliday junction branch migration protein RuvA [Gemmatimonadaceae bacterium]|nr:Holliday junction branch migration protein RuvA [Gemmatimonadaceae bacterium]